MKLQHLNEPQRQAVMTVEEPCLVLAGAGSGKTRVITQKIAWLIRESGYRPEKIRAVTFTNKAAKEMKQRAGELLGKQEARGLRISTFHTLGLNILQREHAHLGYRKGFSILDARDAEDCIAELQHKDNPEAELIKQTQWRISQWKNDFITPEQALAAAENSLEQHQARVYLAYREQLQACNAVDFDDLIMLPVQLFRQQPEVLDQWRERIHYLLVDEYQDTNASQYELIKLLCGMRQKLTVVGDDDQSIYAWRGARPENIRLLQQDFPTLKVIKLEQNYRSTSRILRVANRVIGNNPHLFDKKLWSAAGDGDFVRVLPCRNDQDEAQQVVVDIIGKHFQGTPWKHFAILYRGNHQSRLYEKLLREHSVPYQITGGTAFFERSEIKDLTAYLRIIANPEDDRALLRIINTPRREIGASTLKTLGEYAAWRHRNLGLVLHEHGLEQKLSRKAWINLQRFADWLEEKRRQAEEMDAMSLARLLIEELAYEDWLRNTSSSQKQAESRMANVEELVSWIGNLQKQQEEPTLDRLVTQLTLMSILENSDDDKSSDSVQLMTFHAAKGLEFPHVYLVGFEEDSIPHFQCQDEEGIQEERRLAYVGITRAEQQLTISYAQTRQKYGEVIQCEPSRFIAEMPAEDLEGAEHCSNRLSPEEKKERGMNHLDSLKAMLGG